MNRLMTPLVALVVAALSLSGCGDSKKDTAAPPASQATASSSVVTTTTTTTPKVDAAADLGLAKAAVLSAKDLPGYTPTPPDPSDDNSGQLPESDRKAFATCLGVDATFLDDTPGEQKAESGDFDKANATVSATVSIDPTTKGIDDGWTAFSSPNAESCLATLFEKVFAKQSELTVNGVTNTKFSVGVGDRSLGYQLEVSASSQGVDVMIYLDFIAALRDRAAIQLMVINPVKPFDRATEVRLTQLMYDRVGSDAA